MYGLPPAILEPHETASATFCIVLQRYGRGVHSTRAWWQKSASYLFLTTCCSRYSVALARRRTAPIHRRWCKRIRILSRRSLSRTRRSYDPNGMAALVTALPHTSSIRRRASTVSASNVSLSSRRRLRGRCPRGERLIDHVPHGHWKTITFVAGLRRRAMVAPLVLDRPMNAT